ncbi:MAG TPA: dodecin family protein [bacterium]|uniref:Uncharacterized protein n=1 Tax=candidate division TA06 bacterium ADurb.Bin417 TaxID=1852828 RepID=A0A1V5M7H2_UNCT6|nr:MAG: hypothetical protein BWY73_01561 [candidate division TA06 bacterium ADurb.Bin417]HNQ34871.1 dodecin family protein [bacterium]HNS48925.1 dodecin family protein [bacterium]
MFKMIEIVAVSPQGFSEAAAAGVEQLASEGFKIHFFEVVELRGAVREGRVKEFQVKIKAAVE